MSDFGKIINGNDIIRILKPLMPNVDIFCADKEYFLPSRKFLWNELFKEYIDDYKYTLDIFDCDDFAIILHAWLIQKGYADKWPHPMCYGEIWGRYYNGGHAINISILDTEEVVLIEAQSKNKNIAIIDFPDSDDVNVSICRM